MQAGDDWPQFSRQVYVFFKATNLTEVLICFCGIQGMRHLRKCHYMRHKSHSRVYLEISQLFFFFLRTFAGRRFRFVRSLCCQLYASDCGNKL